MPSLAQVSASLTRRALAHFDHASGDGTSQGSAGLDIADTTLTVPASDFTGAERLQRDRAMMQAVPHVVAWGGEIPNPGDFATKDVAGTSVLLTRTSDGAVRAFVNACAHRGAKVAQGTGNSARFTCQYHAWSYDGDGTLVGLPARNMFDPETIAGLGLRPLPATEVAGLVVISLDRQGSVDTAFADIAEALAGYNFGHYAHAATETLQLAANWKFIVDVNFEGYHFPTLHRDTLAPFATNNSNIDTFGPHARWAFPFRAIEELREVPEEHWPERFTGTVVHFLFPSCVLVDSPTSPQMIRVYPGESPGTCVAHISQGSFGPIETEEQLEAGLRGLQLALAVLRDEDFPAAENCQHGVEKAIPQILIGRNEPLLQHLHNMWDASAT